MEVKDDIAELKPCPFCGGVARLLVLSKGVKVMCTECDCQTDTYDDSNPFYGLDSWRDIKWPNAVEKAIEAWNRRSEDKS